MFIIVFVPCANIFISSVKNIIRLGNFSFAVCKYFDKYVLQASTLILIINQRHCSLRIEKQFKFTNIDINKQKKGFHSKA